MKRLLTALIAAAILLTTVLATSGCATEGLHLGQASIVTTSTTFKTAPEPGEEQSSEPEPSSEDEGGEAEVADGDSSSEDGSEDESSAPEPAKPAFEGGSVGVNVLTASITLDKENVIRSLKLDKYELAVEVDENGYLVGDISTDGVKSAKELAYDYGMKSSSKLSLEWFEQVANFEKWAVGKKVGDLLNMKTVYIDDTRPSVPGEPDLSVSVSISVGDFLKVIRLAAINAGWDPSSGRLAEESEEEEVTYSSFFISDSVPSGSYEDEAPSSSAVESEGGADSGSENASSESSK
ncbi:MAG: hypothetical protein IJU94_04510 [Clostridia bacterium]|nr:hypothetical protein [Clostridia bacterium]